MTISGRFAQVDPNSTVAQAGSEGLFSAETPSADYLT
jgi:hypothetical protein